METRVYLRAISELDTDDILRWRNSKEIKKFFIYQGDLTREGQKKWLDTKVKSGEVVQFIIVEKEGDRPIGSVYLRDVDKEMRKAEFGIFIGEQDSLGKGYGGEAARLILKYAFEEMKLHRVYLRAIRGNERAISCYEKAGFSIEGILKDDVRINGEYRDIVWMAAVRESD